MITAVRTYVLPALAISATLLFLWYVHMPAPDLSSDLAQVKKEAEAGGYRLIDVESLSALTASNREPFLLVDTRQEWEHRAGHIKGSVNFPMEPTWWARWRKKAALKTLLGPAKDKSIVFY